MDVPECCICCEGLNDSAHRPRCLPCGHTVCTMCIDKTITKGDKSCPSCRQPHHVTAASQLPVNYALEEIFQKFLVKSGDNHNIKTEVLQDDKEKKENIISEAKDFICSIATTMIELQKELNTKASLIDQHQAQIEQKLTEVECLKKDIQEENKVKYGIEETLAALDEKRKFLENSVQNISKASGDITDVYEDVKRRLHMNDSQKSATYFQPRIEHLVRAEDGLGLVIIGGSEMDFPIYIRTISPGSAAQKHGGLKPGDRILSVNGMSIEGKSLKYAGDLLKSTLGKAGEVKLEVRYTPGALDGFLKTTRRVFV